MLQIFRPTISTRSKPSRPPGSSPTTTSVRDCAAPHYRVTQRSESSELPPTGTHQCRPHPADVPAPRHRAAQRGAASVACTDTLKISGSRRLRPPAPITAAAADCTARVRAYSICPHHRKHGYQRAAPSIHRGATGRAARRRGRADLQRRYTEPKRTSLSSSAPCSADDDPVALLERTGPFSGVSFGEK